MKATSAYINKNQFALKVVLPSVLTIVLFLVFNFGFIIPYFELSQMNAKKQMIREIVFSGICITDELAGKVTAGELTLQEAQTEAATIIGSMRYGVENKDYLWITDLEPVMIKHPYRTELNGNDLSDFTDARGKRMFVEFVEKSRSSGEAYVDYMWQWMDDSTRIVPKISFVMEYKPWGWLIGTGVYLEDIRHEIAGMKRLFIASSLVIFILMTVLLTIIIRRNLRVEKQRLLAEQHLKESRERYRTLVEASADGTLLFLDGKFIYGNQKMKELLKGREPGSISSDLTEILHPESNSVISQIRNFQRDNLNQILLEATLLMEGNTKIDVLITISKVTFSDKEGFIYVFKDLIRPAEMANESLLARMSPLVGESSALGIFSASLQGGGRITAFSAALPGILGYKNPEDLKHVSLLSLMENQTESKELIRYIIRYRKLDGYRIALRKPDGLRVILKLYAAMVPDAMTGGEQLTGIFIDAGNMEVTTGQEFKENNLLKTSEGETGDTGPLQPAAARIALYPEVKSLLERGTKSTLMNTLITGRSEQITQMLAQRTISELGPPPVRFALLALGSEARNEQTLLSDQDNALLFDDQAATDPSSVSYFLRFGKRMNELLADAGYEWCKGEVMAGNPKWNQPLSGWIKTFSAWISEPIPQHIVDFSVFHDFRTIYGDPSLTELLREAVQEMLRKTPAFYGHMAMANLNYKLPLNTFGRIQADVADDQAASINIKNASRVLVNLVRLYAVKNNIRERNTLLRIEELHKCGVFPFPLYNDLNVACEVLMNLQLRQQVYAFENRLEPGHNLNLSMLSPIELNTLKNIFLLLNTFQNRLKHDFGVGT
jgi:PAS domain-containing protein